MKQSICNTQFKQEKQHKCIIHVFFFFGRRRCPLCSLCLKPQLGFLFESFMFLDEVMAHSLVGFLSFLPSWVTSCVSSKS